MGSVVISVDAELGWGFHDRTGPSTPENRAQWFTPELVAAVRDADTTHELACHSYAHVELDRVSKDRARTEVGNV